VQPVTPRARAALGVQDFWGTTAGGEQISGKETSKDNLDSAQIQTDRFSPQNSEAPDFSGAWVID
jgi:hypothetical protein